VWAGQPAFQIPEWCFTTSKEKARFHYSRQIGEEEKNLAIKVVSE